MHLSGFGKRTAMPMMMMMIIKTALVGEKCGKRLFIHVCAIRPSLIHPASIFYLRLIRPLAI